MLFFLNLMSCSKEDAGPTVDAALTPYFDRFIEEGEAQGLDMQEVSAIQGSLETISDDGVVGQCIHNSNEPNHVIISQAYWNTASDLRKEFIVFHELGHCFLSRTHLDASERGQCLSIMHSSDDVCRINYSINTRRVYIDELFNP